MVVASSPFVIGPLALFFTIIHLSSVIAFTPQQQYNSGFNYAITSSSMIGRSRKLVLHVERSGSNSSSSSSQKKTMTNNLSQDELQKIVELEQMMEYEYNEADFADYVSDYSANDDEDAFDDDDEDDDVFNDNYDTNNLDIRGDGGSNNKKGGGDSSSILSGYDESSYTSIGGFDLSPFEKHAREVFLTYALQVQSTLEYTDINLGSQISNTQPQQRIDNAAIMKKDLFDMLQTLDIDASLDESEALFKYLDIDDDGQVTLEEFLPWYAEAIDSAQQTAIGFQNLVKSRRTIHKFDATEVDDGVLRRALECAIAAPNRRGTEPWRFIKLGKETVAKVVKLREEMNNNQQQRGITDSGDGVVSSSSSSSTTGGGGGGGVDGSFVSWTKVPHWIVVTYPKADAASGPDGKMQQREDFKSTCCAVQNLLLSMWSEGIGTKWTDGPIQRTQAFADICGIDLEREKVAGVIWYGFARGGLNSAGRGEVKLRRKGVEEVLDILP